MKVLLNARLNPYKIKSDLQVIYRTDQSRSGTQAYHNTTAQWDYRPLSPLSRDLSSTKKTGKN
ncbi:unnamed protein product [Prunus armeniaca]|uniref:Uncharacterized protein n=1 Tax=Prunus armeniaca TaxID=36596 RepID=A0A6J5TNX8_PRUAR|nr:unnamed protein product [Prunus armeniaca]CAB4295326.1 unnamed protein product [Prunus armeniaca]